MICIRLKNATWLILGLLMVSIPVVAQDDAWQPPVPEPGSLDWLQIKSGEWLPGEIKSLRDEYLEFDSEEFDDIELDWDKVVVLRSPRVLTFGFEKNGQVAGTAIMQGNVIKIQTAAGIRELPRSDLLGIIEGKPSEWNYWSFKASFGLLLRSGNTEQNDFNTLLWIRRQTTRTRVNLEYNGALSEVQETETVNNHRVTGFFDYLITRGFYVTPIAAELYSDRFQNINLRSTIAAGVGYYVFRRSKLEWNLGLSGGYQSTEFQSVETGQPTGDESAVVIPSTNLETDITKDLELTFNFNAQVTLPDTDGTLYHTFLLFEYELTSVLDLDLSLTWDRVQNPRADAEGNVPERDDLRTSIGFGLDF